MNNPIDNVLDKLSNVKQTSGGYTALCPAHDDKQSSLSVSESDTGAVLIHCHAGCDTADVLSAIGLKMTDLYPPKQMGSTNQTANAKIAATYKYTDADKKLLYEVVRYEPKGFRQRQPNGNGGWNWSMKGVNRVLYQLPIVKEAVKRGQTIFVVEGEKDAGNVIQKLKLPATTNVGGAEKWNASYSKALTGADVIILPDNDEPGRKHAQIVAQALQGYAKTVKVVELPNLPVKGDVSDWINNGGTRDELLEMAEDTSDWEPKPVQIPKADTHNETPFELRLTDAGNAQAFIKKYGDNLRYDVTAGEWLIWNCKRWEIDELGKVRQMAENTIRALYDELPKISDMKQAQEMLRHIRASLNLSRLDAVLALAGSNPAIAVTNKMLDRNDWLLNCSNGILDLRTGKLKPHDKNALITKLVPVDYDADAKCPRFEQFLNEVFGGDRELIQFVQRAIGYTLTGDTSEQCFFMLHGNGSNGKSTLVNIMREILTDYHRKTSTDTILEKQNGGIPNDVARLAGARFVSTVEANPNRKMAEELVKELTGGDAITARFLHHEFFDFVPTFKLWLACNHKPSIDGQDNGIWRRIKLIPFNVQFNSRESGKPPYKDSMLADKLRMEYQGILAWMVRGCLDWQSNRLGTCKAVEGATAEYRDDQDILAEFINENCEELEGAQVKSSDLYCAYAQWCARGGMRHPYNQKTFTQRMKERGYKCKHLKIGNTWFDIELKYQNEEPIYIDEAQYNDSNIDDNYDKVKYGEGSEGTSGLSLMRNKLEKKTEKASHPSPPFTVNSELGKSNNCDNQKPDETQNNRNETGIYSDVFSNAESVLDDEDGEGF